MAMPMTLPIIPPIKPRPDNASITEKNITNAPINAIPAAKIVKKIVETLLPNVCFDPLPFFISLPKSFS